MRKPNSFTTERHIKVGYEGNGLIHHKFFEKDYVSVHTDNEGENHFIGEIQKIKTTGFVLDVYVDGEAVAIMEFDYSDVTLISKVRRVRNA